MKRRKRIVFTERELDRILDMAAIAEANVAGEGDYQEWTEADYKAVDRLATKAAVLKSRFDAEKQHFKKNLDV